MAERATDQLEKLWRSGSPLSIAWITYAHPELKAQWTELKGKSALTALSASVEQAGQQEKPDPIRRVEFVQNLLQPAQAILQDRSDVKGKMQSNIREYMKNGHAFAYGFEPPRKLVSVPVELPKGVWGGKFDWDNSTITYAGLSFVQVRLTTRRIRDEILDRSSEPFESKTSTRPGRPTVGPDIEEAFHALHEAGEIDTKSSASSHYDKIREWLHRYKPDLPVEARNLGHEVIRKNFMPLFRGLKKNHKL